MSAVPTRADLLSLCYMLALYGGAFVIAATIGEPISTGAFGLILILLGIGTYVVLIQRLRIERALKDLLQKYAREYAPEQS